MRKQTSQRFQFKRAKKSIFTAWKYIVNSCQSAVTNMLHHWEHGLVPNQFKRLVPRGNRQDERMTRSAALRKERVILRKNSKFKRSAQRCVDGNCCWLLATRQIACDATPNR